MGMWKRPGVKINVAISLCTVSSRVPVDPNQYLRSMSSSSSNRCSLRASIPLGERMGFPLSGRGFDVWISMTCVIYAYVLTPKVSLESGGYGLFLGDINWLPWVVNMSEVQCMECGDPLCELIRESGGVEE